MIKVQRRTHKCSVRDANRYKIKGSFIKKRKTVQEIKQRRGHGNGGLKRDKKVSELEAKMENLEEPMRAHAKKLQAQDKQLGAQRLRLDDMREQVTEIQENVKQETVEARQTAASTVQLLREEIKAGNKKRKRQRKKTKALEEKMYATQKILVETLKRKLGTENCQRANENGNPKQVHKQRTSYKFSVKERSYIGTRWNNTETIGCRVWKRSTDWLGNNTAQAN